MAYKIKKNHDKLRLADGICGHFLKTMDGKDVMMEDILKIELQISSIGSYDVVAIMKDGRRVKELFGSSNYNHATEELRRYRKQFDEFLRSW